MIQHPRPISNLTSARSGQHAAGSKSPFTARRLLPAARCSAFTLTEILVVITIVVLILGMAMPVFRFITGSRSEEGATNQISAMLGRARANAIGLQEPQGVAFFVDSNGNYKMALAVKPNIRAWVAGTATNKIDYKKFDYVSYPAAPAASTRIYVCWQDFTSDPSLPLTVAPPTAWNSLSVPPTVSAAAPYWGIADWNGAATTLVDRVGDSDSEALPLGVGVQLINDCQFVGGYRVTDGYLSAGVIMFDGQGSLISQQMCFAGRGRIGVEMNFGLDNIYPDPNRVYPVGPTKIPLYTQFGLTVFQRAAFNDLNFTTLDWQTQNPFLWPSTPPAPPQTFGGTSSGSGTDEFHEEAWLDTNSTPLLINRYNGTLIKGE